MKCQQLTTKQNYYKYWYEPCTRKAKYVVTTMNKNGFHKTFCCGIHKNSILKRHPTAIVEVLPDNVKNNKTE